MKKAIKLRRNGLSYEQIGRELGLSTHAVYRRFRKEYDAGNLTELRGYRAARLLDPRKNSDDLRCGATLPVGSPVKARLSPEEKYAVLDLMQKGRHQTMNDLLLELLRRELGG